MPTPLIDVHHHLFPPAFVAHLLEQDHYLTRGVARHWTPQVSLDDMDAAGVTMAMTSVTAPGLAGMTRERRVHVNRECNDYGARMVSDHPTRFGLFAGLPLPDLDASLREVEHTLDVLGADGIGLMTSYGDRWLGDAAFAPVMDELDRRRAVVYVHPAAPDCCRNLVPGVADWVLEFPIDTVRTIASLLFSGTVRRCPNIRFVFAHVGGVLPFLVDHLARAAQTDPRLAAMVPDGVPAALARLHFDTALRNDTAPLRAALQMAGASQLLFGSDAPLRRSTDQLGGLRGVPLDPEDRRRIEYGNAQRLLPRCRCGEDVSSWLRPGT